MLIINKFQLRVIILDKKNFTGKYLKNFLKTSNSFIWFEVVNISLSSRHDNSNLSVILPLLICLGIYCVLIAPLFSRKHWVAVGGLWFMAVTEFKRERRKEAWGVQSRLRSSTFRQQWLTPLPQMGEAVWILTLWFLWYSE